MWGVAEIIGTLKTLKAGVLFSMEAVGYTGKGTFKGIMKVKQSEHKQLLVGDLL